MHAAPIYIAETSPRQIRGILVSMKEFFIILGLLVSPDRLIDIRLVQSQDNHGACFHAVGLYNK